MKRPERVVVDTNVLVSRLLLPRSFPGRAADRAIGRGQLLASDETIKELADVLARPKFDAYLSVGERQELLRLLLRLVEWVPSVRSIRACRDPRDDKFLELAVNGQADLVVSGDEDLLALDPFRGISILTPRQYLEGD